MQLNSDLLAGMAAIVTAYVQRNQITPPDLAALIPTVYSALAGTDVPPPAQDAELKPAVPIGKSVTKTHLICLEDGVRLKMLKRYLKRQHNLTPEEYRAKWGLPASYPMVAPSYAARRSEIAKASGLGGRSPRAKSIRRRKA